MAFQETVTTGYGQRLSGGFGGIWQGLLLIIGATVAIWWNEGRAVKTAGAIKDAKGAAVEMTDNSTINPQFEGKLIHTMGMLTCDETIADQQFGVQVQGAIRIARSVEYYQWVEHSESHTEDKVGGSQETTTTYTYDKQWVSSPVESADFHDPDYKSVNTVITSVPNERFSASRVKLGAYNLNSAQISGFSNGANLPISVPEETLAQLQQKYSANFQADSTGNKPQVVSTSGNVIYIGQSAAAPQIGDVRISYVTHMPTTVSVVCQVCGDTFTDYLADNGEAFSAMENGAVPAAQMFQNAEQSNTILTWVLRIIIIIFIFNGFKSLFNFLPALTNFLPFLSTILNFGVKLVAGVLTAIWAGFWIALAWLFYRPIISIIILAVVGVIVFFVIKKKKESSAAAPAPAPVSAAPVSEAQQQNQNPTPQQ
ncbi:MAG: TMEM43 family protein [Bacteroidales bacterium]|nr:TMEM43 family protein [Bacteroidales bacterium]MDY4520432.1 TMEM43 family protein [Bacteroidales bacterium]